MANYTLIARINAGNGKFPFVNVQFTKNHRPIPIAGATYYPGDPRRFKSCPFSVCSRWLLRLRAAPKQHHLQATQTCSRPTVRARPQCLLEIIGQPPPADTAAAAPQAGTANPDDEWHFAVSPISGFRECTVLPRVRTVVVYSFALVLAIFFRISALGLWGLPKLAASGSS